MRKGDPALARSGETWTAKHKPFGSPVQRSIGPNQNAPNRVAQASNQGTAGAVDANQRLKGEFNVGNGGIQPKGKMNF